MHVHSNGNVRHEWSKILLAQMIAEKERERQVRVEMSGVCVGAGSRGVNRDDAESIAAAHP